MVKNLDSSPPQMDPSRSKMSSLPSELLREILARMSVEDLMLLRCVCSSWCNAIDCPMFRLQHIMSSSSSATPKLILSSKFGCYKLSFEKIAPSTTPGNKPIPAKVVRIKNPITHGHEIRCLNNSDNGLVLLIDETKHKFIVWNPFTRQHLKFPVSNLFEKDMAYGIGVNEVSKDCKFVFIRTHLDSSPDILVYKLRMNRDNCSTPSCWKPMEHLPVLGLGFSSDSHGGVFVSGALHWIVHHEHYSNKSVLLVVDLGTEKYSLLRLPQTHTEDLCVLGGCLCVTIPRLIINRPWNQFRAWVMKRYGVVESWTRLYVVSPYDLGVPSGWVVRPVAFSNCGSWVLLSCGSGLVWYHLRNKSAKLIKLQGWRKVSRFTATVYAGSLFPLNRDTTKPRNPPTTMQRKRKSS